MTGIQSWHPSDSNQAWPFNTRTELLGLFRDATFLQFYPNIPEITSVLMVEDRLQLIIKCDVETVTVSIDPVTALENQVIQLSGSKKHHGSLVLGNGVSSVADKATTELLTSPIPFHTASVKWMYENSAVYSLGTVSGPVLLESEAGFFEKLDSTTVELGFVTKPDRRETITMSAGYTYAMTDKGCLIKFNGSSIEKIGEFPIAPVCMIVVGDMLIGALGAAIYSFNENPPRKLVTMPANVTAFAYADMLYCLAGEYIFSLDFDNEEYTQVKVLTGKRVRHLLDVNNNVWTVIVQSIKSGNNYQASQVKDITVDNTTTTVGSVTVDGSYTYGQVIGTYKSGSSYYAFVQSNTAGIYSRVKLVALTYDGIEQEELVYAGQYGTITCFVPGSALSLYLQQVSPLKTLNNVVPVNNHIELVGDGLLQLRGRANGQIECSLSTDFDRTKISRAIKYD